MGLQDRFSELELVDIEASEAEINLLKDAVVVVQNARVRRTIAEINAGATLLDAVSGKSYRILGIKAIAYGGAVAAATSVEVEGVQGGSSADLLSIAIAGLTQSAVVDMAHTNSTVLADGASFVANDSGEAITVSKTGSDITTATGIDFIIDFVLE
jgi:hypothetical protein